MYCGLDNWIGQYGLDEEKFPLVGMLCRIMCH